MWMNPAGHKSGVLMDPGISLSSWSQDEMIICIEGTKVEQNVFFPKPYFWSNIWKQRSSNQRHAVFRPPFGRLIASAARQHLDRYPVLAEVAVDQIVVRPVDPASLQRSKL